MRYKSLFGSVNKFRALFAVLTPEVTSVRRALTEDMRRRESERPLQQRRNSANTPLW